MLIIAVNPYVNPANPNLTNPVVPHPYSCIAVHLYPECYPLPHPHPRTPVFYQMPVLSSRSEMHLLLLSATLGETRREENTA